MKRLMIAAMESGSGKTVLTCALLQAMQDLGLQTASCKCGPDYIDPMFHRLVTGEPSYNLDWFLQGRSGVHRALSRLRADILLVEGAMGYFDGLSGTEEASAAQLAAEENIPVLLALHPKGSSLTLAAQVRGLMEFRSPCRIAGLFLTSCSPSLHAHLRPVLERETGLPVTGFLPPMEEAALSSRHLGLIPAAEVAGLKERFRAVAERLKETADLETILALAEEAAAPEENPENRIRSSNLYARTGEPGSTAAASVENSLGVLSAPPRCRIAVARDEAFCFYYQESLELLRACGAELIFFSPLRDTCLPAEADGLYLGGGYPELHGRELGENDSMRRSVREAVQGGLPTVAECGGFLYLQQFLKDTEGNLFPMAGALPGEGFPAGRLVRFGYASLLAEQDSLLFRRGERIPVHEFHHWDSTENGTDLPVEKIDGRTWRCGHAGPALYAAFPHLHMGGELPMAERFITAAAAFRAGRAEYDSN